MAADAITVSASREAWLSVVYAVYAAYWEGLADPVDALPIMEALGIAPGERGVLPDEVEAFERRRIAAVQRKRKRKV